MTAFLSEIIAGIDRAHKEVGDAARRQWDGQVALAISIPARPDRDSDLIIGNALRQARNFIAAQAKEIAELKEKLNAIDDFLFGEKRLSYEPDRVLMLQTVRKLGEAERDRLKAELASVREWGGRCQQEMEQQSLAAMDLRAEVARLKAEVEQTHREYDALRQQLAECREALTLINAFKFTLFEDGLSADLHDEGITTVEQAYARGISDACDELKPIARAVLAATEPKAD